MQFSENLKLFVTFLLVVSIQGGAVISNTPIQFQMTGATTYIPDTGGATQNGYTLTLGFSQKSWLAVEFVVAGQLKTDVLVLKIDDFYSSNSNALFQGHQVSYEDYSLDSSNSLSLDTTTSNDISSYNYSDTKDYQITITRFLGSNGGEDWDASAHKYGVLKTCFYTSDKSFDSSNYKQQTSVCYNYEIDNLVSKFVGEQLKSFYMNGYTTKIYGWIDGPELSNHVYFYQNVPLFTYTRDPAVVIEIGTTAGKVGQDYYATSPTGTESGDYYGTDISSLSKDNTATGFISDALTLKTWNSNPLNQISDFTTTSLRLMFNRATYTYDNYDKQLLSTFIFCIYLYTPGTITATLSDKSCEVVELSKLFVQTSYEGILCLVFLSLLLILAF